MLEIQLVRVRDAIEEERMRWSRRRYTSIVIRLEQRGKVAEWPLPARHVDHCTDQESHHVMQKTICFDLEDQTAGPVAPASDVHDAPMIVVGWRGSQHRERAKAVIAFQHRRGEVERRSIQLVTHGQLARPPKR
jgi:hypothetical protein